MKNFVRLFSLVITCLMLTANFGVAQQIIVVDRDGSTQYPDSFTDDWQYLQPALDALAYPYDYVEVVDLANDGPDAATMSAYDIAFWFTGEVWSDGETLTANDEYEILLYLTLYGGNLLLSSQDFLYDKYPDAGILYPGEFPHDGLGLAEVAQDVWNIEPDTGNIMGVAGSCIAGVPFTVFDIYTGLDDDGLYIDEIVETLGDYMMEVVYPDPIGYGATQWNSGTFRSIFSTVSYAAIMNLDERIEVLDRSISWLLGTTGTTLIKMEQSDMLVYPNPATTSVRIGCKDKIQEIWVMNSTGQVIDHINSNDYTVMVNTSAYTSGIYFIRAVTDKGTSTSRLIVK
ncbi:T9SS type A sorting domain-containing protein [Bacteroidota bacterium]